MIRSLKTFVGVAVLLAPLCTAIEVEAQAFGRVKFEVVDPEGKPVQGANVVATCDELGNFRQERKTDKKGLATLAVVDATKVYQIEVTAEGYPAYRLEVKPQIGQTISEKVELTSGAPPPPAEGVLTPAQEAFNAGVEASQAGDLVTAKAKFLETLERDSSIHIAHLALASLYFDEGDLQAALKEVEQLLKADPKNTRGLRILYEVHTKLGNKGEAKAALQVLSDLDQGGDAAAALYNEGVAAFKIGDNATAKESFQKALEAQPDLLPAVKALAQIYFKAGEFASAAEMVERLVASEPENATYLRMRWETYRALGDSEKERAAFQALAAQDPKVLIDEFMQTGAKLFESGDAGGAKEQFEKVLVIDPDHARAHYRLGLCLVNLGETAAAKEHLQRFVDLAPEDPEAATAKEMLSYLG